MTPLTIAVIGAGEKGRAFAHACAAAGMTVILEDVLPEKLRRAEELVASRPVIGELRFVSTVEDAVRNADIAVDFVPDELESKLEIFSLLDRMAAPRTILCTPTEAMSITDLASCTYRPDRCIALRGIVPGSVLVRGSATSDATVELVSRMLSLLGKEAQVELDTNAPLLTKNQ